MKNKKNWNFWKLLPLLGFEPVFVRLLDKHLSLLRLISWLGWKYLATWITKYLTLHISRSSCRRPQFEWNSTGTDTVNPQIRLAGLILFSRFQMRVLLEIEHFCLLFFKLSVGLIRIQVLLEGESYSRIYGRLYNRYSACFLDSQMYSFWWWK